MKLTIDIYTQTPAEAVQVGELVDAGQAGPILINEVRHLTTSNGGIDVSLYGHRVGSDALVRREHRRFRFGDSVRVLPGEDTACEVWAAVCAGIDQARNAWLDDYDGDGDGDKLRPPWEHITRPTHPDDDCAAGHQLRVTHGDTDYLIDVAVLPENGHPVDVEHQVEDRLGVDSDTALRHAAEVGPLLAGAEDENTDP